MTKRVVDIDEIFARGTPVDDALNEAVRQVVERHRQAGLPLVVWRNGQVEYVSADEIEPQTASGERRDTEIADCPPPSVPYGDSTS